MIISKVPILDDEKENEARRFISIIDEFYERKVKLVLTTDTCYRKLYQGKRLNFEFERTKTKFDLINNDQKIKLQKQVLCRTFNCSSKMKNNKAYLTF